MSIYARALGDRFNDLHPMLQKRYGQLSKRPFYGRGIMKTIHGGPKWLAPIFYLGTRWKLLFPESGTDIPFSITNTPKIGKGGEEQVHWERVFHFPDKKRYFNALMSLDDRQSIIKDYLGEPPLVYSDLTCTVNASDGSLTIESRKQRLILGRWELPLPRIFQGFATVTERYIDDRETYSIHVRVHNPLIGTVFSYEGVFTYEEKSIPHQSYKGRESCRREDSRAY